MPLEKSKVKKILVISLSNIGDVVLTFPVVDVLRNEFPQALITVLVGPKAEEFFKKNTNIVRVISYNKRQSAGKMIALVQELRREKFDMVIDLRNTAIPLLIGAPYHTPFFASKEEGRHKKDQHLNRLRSVFKWGDKSPKRICVEISAEDRNYVRGLLKGEAFKDGFVIMAPGAANHNKRWPYDRMAQLADTVIEKYHKPVVFVGDLEDQRITILISRNMKHDALDLTGQLTLIQLAYALQECSLFIGNDSAPMHLASYFEKPVLAFFGPTDPNLYGPWSGPSTYLQKKINCQACLDPTIANHDCIRAVSLQEAAQSFQIVNDQVMFTA